MTGCFKENRKAQVAIYIIIAIVIAGGIITFFVFREKLFAPAISPELKPVFDYYESCIEEEAVAAIQLAGEQGGWVYAPDYIAGSEYAPSSSQLNFLGTPVPYWYYLSGNGVLKEQVPTRVEMEEGISRFVEERLNQNCDFEIFYARAIDINLSEVNVETTISDESVSVTVSSALSASKDETSARKTEHLAVVSSRLGKMYNSARNIYGKQKKEAFLENYSVDVLRLYAPVDGVELSCSGKTWVSSQVAAELKEALEANMAAIKFKGDYYTLSRESEKYFVVDLPVDSQINLLYSRNWPTKIEIDGADGELMSAFPVGNQPGMGVMGFCYAPYHFVYDVTFPVLVQIFDGNELFQFPVIIIISKNMPREPILSEIAAEEETIDLCEYKTQDLTVNVYNINLNPVEANLSFICFTQRCNLGETENGVFVGMAPACVNGYLRVNAAGYAEKRQLLSTNEENYADVILDREYDVEIEVEAGGAPLKATAMVSFYGAKTASAILPEISNVKLSEGIYNISVMIYGNSSIAIPETKKNQCIEVTRKGIAGFFGSKEEKCFEVTIPATNIEAALIGGGNSEMYLLPSDLEDGKIKLSVDLLPTPTSLNDLSKNFEEFEDKGVDLA